MLLCPHSTARGIEVRTSHLLEAREAVRCWSQWSAALIHYTHCLTIPNAQPQPDAEKQGIDTRALEKWFATPNFLSHSAWALWTMLPRPNLCHKEGP